MPQLRELAILVVVACLACPALAGDSGIQTSRYVFSPDQSTIIQTGGIAGVHWTYRLKGQFVLSIDPNTGTASFSQVDANAIDDSPYRRTLDPNEVFAMTALAGTIVDDSTLSFKGEAANGVSVRITATLKNGSARLVAETTPPPGSADFFVYSMDATAQRKYAGGTGEPNTPYQIATAADLIALGNEPNDYGRNFILTADIDLDPNLPGRKVFSKAVIWGEVPHERTGRPRFSGTFNGSGHTISHLTITGTRELGLFDALTKQASVKNMGIVDANIIGTSSVVGALASSNGGVITRCYATGRVIGTDLTGGLLGGNAGTVIQCYSTATVCGDSKVGGLAGNNTGTVNQCYNTGTVDGTSTYVGGLVGYNIGTIEECYSIGMVNGTSYAGGLVGCSGSSEARVTRCYSTGTVHGGSLVGGLLGYHHGGSTVLCNTWDVETSGQSQSDGGAGLTTREMMDPYTLGVQGFANDPNWVLDAYHDYPRLAWEGRAGQVIPMPAIGWLKGGGTADDPFQIESAEQLTLVSSMPFLLDKHIRLTADIDLNSGLPIPLVLRQAMIPYFEGTFDGDGHSISNLCITGTSEMGLVAQLGSRGEVTDLRMVDVYIMPCPVSDGTGASTGALVGWNRGRVTRCGSTGYVLGGRATGGIVGLNENSVLACFSTADVEGLEHTGGLVGCNDQSVSQCFSTGSVRGRLCVGGLVGYNGGTVTQSYSRGSVRAAWYTVGGLVGYNNSGKIAEGYSTGKVTGDGSHIGGLVGDGRSIEATDCFWDTQTSAQSTSSAGTGKATAEMKTGKTFTDAGWDFVGETANGTADIWWIDEGKDYPRLWWETEDER
jgi:hypothetical protein